MNRKIDIITSIIATPFVLVLGLLWGVVASVIYLFYVPIKFVLMLWEKDDNGAL